MAKQRSQRGKRIAIVGAGVSGIAAASVLNRLGHETVLFEKAAEIGGIWALGYPGVALQNTRLHYELSQFPWPEEPDLHPTGLQIERYLRRAVQRLSLDVRTEHEVVRLEEKSAGWTAHVRHQRGEESAFFDFVIPAIGQYTDWKHVPAFEGQARFRGQIITERDVKDLEVFRGKRTVIVGFGKSAVDMAAAAAELAPEVRHVFRTPRWMIPHRILGQTYSSVLFCRASTVFMPCWDQPTAAERFLHRRTPWAVDAFWSAAAAFFRWRCLRHARGAGEGAARRLQTVLPDHELVKDLRSAAAMAPQSYYAHVASGRIRPHRAELAGFVEEGVALVGGEILPCDQVLLCVGSETPRFPFLPDEYRKLLEGESDGPQLYRHLIHPDIPHMAFAGYNHGFMHIPSAEVGTLWLCALLREEIALPSRQDMLASMDRVREWKRRHIHFEPSRSCAVNTRFQQYLDVLLKELRVSPYRKLPNVFSEVVGEYGARDYFGVIEEYERRRTPGSEARAVLPLDT
ncbi:MAG: NAD(P)/FAD-dependent oxidoreductase [Myxococcales bacterium]|nr:NAD(P)/FAD-dependent oxidoreductase [Myxococcales bacterium]